MPRRIVTRAVLLLAAMLLALPSAAAAQEISITPIGGFRVGGGMREYYTGSQLDIKDNWTYGGIVDIGIPGDRAIELLYSYQGTELTVRGGTIGPQSEDLNVHVWQAGVLQEKAIGPTLNGYGVGTLGVTHFSWEGDSSTRFAVGFGGGLKVFPERRVGLRLDARGFVTFVNTNGFYIAGGGSGISASFSSDALFQAEFLGGVTFRFGS